MTEKSVDETQRFISKAPVVTDDQGLLNAVTIFIQAALLIGLLIFLLRRDWENAALSLTVIGLIVIPAFFLKRYKVHVPPDFQLAAVAFAYLSLFLGSASDFYYRFWWWDLALHVSSGFLLGILGWITLFLLNETDRVPKGIQPGFLCFFAITFASFLGVVWEILEYAVDRFAPSINMQSNETGVADTMHDLIWNTVGSVVVAAMGWAHIKWGQYSFVVALVRSFVKRNPGLFGKTGKSKVK